MNVLVDTSVWIEHLKRPCEPLIFLLNNGRVLTHYWIVAELALGTFKGRDVFLRNLNLLPKSAELSSAELFLFIEDHSLRGLGVGLVDVQILASAKISDSAILTRDKSLRVVSERLKIPLA
jgi:predicted nucleic acid-binding protein